MLKDTLHMDPEKVKPDLDDLEERMVVSLKNAADAAHERYQAAPGGELGAFIRRVKTQLNDLLEEVVGRL